MYKLGSIILFLCLGVFAKAQIDIVTHANNAVDGNQKRIDSYDGVQNDTVNLLSKLQTNEATQLYFRTVDQIQQNINNNTNYTDLQKKQRLNDLSRMLEKVDRSNYHLYTTFSNYFHLIIRIQEIIETDRITAMLSSDILTTLNVIPFFDTKPYASKILQKAAKIYPSEVLKHYGDFAFQTYSVDVLEELCKSAPAHVSFYMGTPNVVFTAMKNATGKPTIDRMMEIYRNVGSNSKAYILLDDIDSYRLTMNEAHNMGKNRESLYKHLQEVRINPNVLGGYSIDNELTYIATQKVREINELHEEEDRIRFRLCDTSKMTSQELYILMVYGEDEVYTSTFLGLFNRLMERMTEESSYEFLHNLGRLRYRTFVKMCSGYNVLPQFLEKMSLWERRSLFNAFISGLQNELNPLEQAVAVADTYGSLADSASRSIFEVALQKEYQQIKWKNKQAEQLYSLLLELLNINSESDDLKDDLANLTKVSNADMLKDGTHIQQHFFFDDEDGWASYNTFIERFNRPGWRVIDKGYYVIIESTAGKKIKLYANKAKEEYDGQDALREYFKTSKRFPDVVVHRGHSYYAQTTIETITPNSDLIILGSCGGYNNISKVLDYSPNAQIITSKQVGTMFVNNELIFSICETLRTGKDIEWETLWNSVANRLKYNQTASERFQDYLPPHKNLGAVLIRNYRKNL